MTEGKRGKGKTDRQAGRQADTEKERGREERQWELETQTDKTGKGEKPTVWQDEETVGKENNNNKDTNNNVTYIYEAPNDTLSAYRIYNMKTIFSEDILVQKKQS